MSLDTFPSGAPHLPGVLSLVLDEPEFLNALIEKNEGSKAVVENVIEKVGENPELQKQLLVGLIHVMSTVEITNRRSAALTIITDQRLGTMITEHSDDVFREYLQAIMTQKPDAALCDDGSLNILVHAGIAIAPRLAWNAKQWKEVKNTFDVLANRYPYIKQGDRIPSQYAEMHQRRSPDPYRDDRIEKYLLKGLSHKVIAKKEKISVAVVETTRTRLIAQGRIRKRNARSEDEEERWKKLKREVKRLRKNDIRNKVIAKLLDVRYEDVTSAISELIAEKELEKSPRVYDIWPKGKAIDSEAEKNPNLSEDTSEKQK